MVVCGSGNPRLEHLGADNGKDAADGVYGDVVRDLGHGESVNGRNSEKSERGADNSLLVPDSTTALATLNPVRFSASPQGLFSNLLSKVLEIVKGKDDGNANPD